jgi:hypothetical protein
MRLSHLTDEDIIGLLDRGFLFRDIPGEISEVIEKTGNGRYWIGGLYQRRTHPHGVDLSNATRFACETRINI